MGFHFSFSDANIVAYLADRRDVPPPRLQAGQLSSFLRGLSDPEEIQDVQQTFISQDREFPHNIQRAAARKMDSNANVIGLSSGEEPTPEALEEVLRELRLLFSAFPLFGLPIYGGSPNTIFDNLVGTIAYSTGSRALVLIPENDGQSSKRNEFLDPFPALRPLVEELGERPGMLFWTPDGTAAYAPVNEAGLLFANLLIALQDGTDDDIRKILLSRRNSTKSKTILHLSDLHLGTARAAQNQTLLIQQLEEIVPIVDRVVITGDLFDQPRESYAVHFDNFNYILRNLCKKQPIVVPGNHDQKNWGNLAPDLRMVADLDWRKVVIDDEMQTVFLCFDSSINANLARGKVTEEQRANVAKEFGALRSTARKHGAKNDCTSYLKVALLHHHPISFQSDAKSPLNRVLSLFGISDEQFLQMENGEEFIDWCARMGVPLILHGHKHFPRHASRIVNVPLPSGTAYYREVNVVGCGTSLGAENKPMSYNLLRWDHKGQRWGVTIYSGPADGSGFESLQPKKMVV